jgi:hypothetical protein
MKFVPRFLLVFLLLQFLATTCWALSSSNIPLDSPVYSYLDKLAGLGLIKGDVKGIRPFSKAEAARLLLEAEESMSGIDADKQPFAQELITRMHELIPREVSLRKNPDQKPPIIDHNLVSSMRFRYVFLDGLPRSYERPVHDPGDDGVFGLGSGLRPANPYPSPVQQHGTEGTPLLENNNGVIYRDGHNGELRWAAEAYLSDKVTGLLEPSILKTAEETRLILNRGYIKVGGGGLELEVGKDENWLGQGYRGAITLTSNAENLTVVKLSSPEPVKIRWLSWLGDLKYSLIASRLDKTFVDGAERQPWFYALKLISKPTDNVEIGFNLGRQQGGPGVNNSISDNIRGLIGGTNADNSNSLAGFELRYRMPWLRNTELYGEFSGEDTAAFWPIVESYVAGFYLPRLTDDGRNDFRFEFFQGNQILYTNGTFPEGYLYKGIPIGHSQGGATQDFFARYSHWFSVRHNLALEYIFTQRGNLGRVKVDNSGNFDVNGAMQAVERKNAGRIHWRVPVHGDVDAELTYGYERINNFDLFPGAKRNNQMFLAEITYRY